MSLGLDEVPHRIGERSNYRTTKRAIDVAVSLVGLVVLLPALSVSSVLIKVTSPGSILFRQERLGHKGRTFTIWKLRTMTDVRRNVSTEVFADHAEVTKVGKVLRRFKIDEFPQLLNILVGDMSLVGPRPSLPEQLQHYTPLAHRRLEVRPGLTGLAQVSGNIYLSWPERWEYDARYVQTMSCWLDLKIVLKTILVILLGEQRFVKWRSGD